MMKTTLLNLFMVQVCAVLVLSGHAASGGPDSYGYTWIDSDEAGGPIFQWVEIVPSLGGSGTLRTNLVCDDCHEANIPLGFNFPFYGTNFSNITISSNGTVYFEDAYLGLSNICMPGTPGYSMSEYKFIAPLWEDLDPSSQGGIYTQAFPEYFVIEYHNIVPCCGPGDGDTWQLILFKNGNILMQYKELSYIGIDSYVAVGIQNSPTVGLQYRCYNGGPNLASNKSILWSPPSFSCGTISQNILGNDTTICGNAMLTLNNDPAAISYTWSNNAVTPSITVSSGTYSIYMLDTNGCTLRDTIIIGAGSAPVVSLGPDADDCESVTLDAGNQGMDYLWSDGSANQQLVVTSSGSYYVEVTDPQSGCFSSDTVNITIYGPPVVSLALASDSVCVNGGSISLSGGLPAGGVYSGTAVTGGIFDPAVAGTGNHTITYTYTDGNGCVDSAAQVISVSACLSLETNEMAGVRIFPNPSSGMVSVETPFEAGAKVEITDHLGRVLQVIYTTSNLTPVNMTLLADGIYFVRVSLAAQSVTHSVILAK